VTVRTPAEEGCNRTIPTQWVMAERCQCRFHPASLAIPGRSPVASRAAATAPVAELAELAELAARLALLAGLSAAGRADELRGRSAADSEELAAARRLRLPQLRVAAPRPRVRPGPALQAEQLAC